MMSDATTLLSHKCFADIVLVRAQLVLVQSWFVPNRCTVVPATTVVLPGGYLRGIRIILLNKTRVVVGIFPAVKLPPWWAVPVKWRFTAIFWKHRLPPKCYRRKTKNRPPPKHYRRIALPPEKYRHILVLPLPPKKYRQLYRYRQKVPPTLNTANSRYRPKGTNTGYRPKRTTDTLSLIHI